MVFISSPKERSRYIQDLKSECKDFTISQLKTLHDRNSVALAKTTYDSEFGFSFSKIILISKIKVMKKEVYIILEINSSFLTHRLI